MSQEIQELIKLLRNNELEYIPATDKRAIKIKVKHGSKDVLCFGIIVPKEYNKEVCGYNYDSHLGLYVKE